MDYLGVIKDLDTNETIRDADSMDWLLSANAQGARTEGSSWKDDDGRLVYRDGGPNCPDDVARVIWLSGVV